MIRVLHVVHWPRTGITSLLLNLIEAQKQTGVESDILILNARADQISEFSNTARHVVAGKNILRGTKAFVRMLRRDSPDVVHTHSFTPSAIVAMHWRNSRHVRTMHSLYPYFSDQSMTARFKRTAERAVLERTCAQVVCVSNGVQNALPYAFNRATVQTIANGLNINAIVARAGARSAKHELYGVGESVFVVCSVGRLEQQKGYDVLIDAVAELPEQVRNRVLVALIGDGTQRTALEQRAASAGVANTVRFLGHQSNPYSFLSAADMYACTSRYEGLSISVAEAMVLGLPVATTRVAGIPEIMVDGENGVIIQELDARHVANAIVRLERDPALRAHMATNSTQLANETMSIDHTAKSYATLYRSMLNAG